MVLNDQDQLRRLHWNCSQGYQSYCNDNNNGLRFINSLVGLSLVLVKLDLPILLLSYRNKVRTSTCE